MKPVQNWRDAWRWHSVQIATVLAVLPIIWPELPPDVQAMVPEAWRPFLVSALAVGAIVGRLRDQGIER